MVMYVYDPMMVILFW